MPGGAQKFRQDWRRLGIRMPATGKYQPSARLLTLYVPLADTTPLPAIPKSSSSPNGEASAAMTSAPAGFDAVDELGSPPIVPENDPLSKFDPVLHTT